MPPNSRAAIFLFILLLPSLLRMEDERVSHHSCMDRGLTSRLLRGDTSARWDIVVCQVAIYGANFLQQIAMALTRMHGLAATMP